MARDDYIRTVYPSNKWNRVRSISYGFFDVTSHLRSDNCWISHYRWIYFIVIYVTLSDECNIAASNRIVDFSSRKESNRIKIYREIIHSKVILRKFETHIGYHIIIIRILIYKHFIYIKFVLCKTRAKVQTAELSSKMQNLKYTFLYINFARWK